MSKKESAKSRQRHHQGAIVREDVRRTRRTEDSKMVPPGRARPRTSPPSDPKIKFSPGVRWREKKHHDGACKEEHDVHGRRHRRPERNWVGDVPRCFSSPTATPVRQHTQPCRPSGHGCLPASEPRSPPTTNARLPPPGSPPRHETTTKPSKATTLPGSTTPTTSRTAAGEAASRRAATTSTGGRGRQRSGP